MASTKTTLKTVRITNEAVDYFRDKPLNRMIEALMTLLESGKVTFDGEELKISDDSGVHTEKSEKSRSATPEIKDIEAMCEVSGVEMEDFYSQIDSLMNEGTIDVSEGKVTILLPDWANEFKEACHDCSIPVEEAGKKAAKALRRGSI